MFTAPAAPMRQLEMPCACSFRGALVGVGCMGRVRGVFWGPLWPGRAWGSALPIPGLGLFLAAQEGALLFLAPQMEGGL